MKGGCSLLVRYGREKLLRPSGYRITPAVYGPRRLHSPCETTVTRTFAFRYWAPAATNCLAATCFSGDFAACSGRAGVGAIAARRISHHAPVFRTTTRR